MGALIGPSHLEVVPFTLLLPVEGVLQNVSGGPANAEKLVPNAPIVATRNRWHMAPRWSLECGPARRSAACSARPSRQGGVRPSEGLGRNIGYTVHRGFNLCLQVDLCTGTIRRIHEKGHKKGTAQDRQETDTQLICETPKYGRGNGFA